jgi:restriction endonuclease S subunit
VLQRGQLKHIRIPFPPLAEQRRIAGLAALMQRERALLRRLDEATQRKHQAIGSALYQGPLHAAITEAVIR